MAGGRDRIDSRHSSWVEGETCDAWQLFRREAKFWGFALKGILRLVYCHENKGRERKREKSNDKRIMHEKKEGSIDVGGGVTQRGWKVIYSGEKKRIYIYIYIAMNGIVPLTHEITRLARVDRCWRSSKARDSESLERDIGAGDPRKSDQTLFPPRQDKVTLNVTLRRVRYLHLWNVGLLGAVRSQLCLDVWLYYARPSQWIRRFYTNSSSLLNTIC